MLFLLFWSCSSSHDQFRSVVFTHSDCVLTDEARETPSAVLDRERRAILNIRAWLLRVVAMVQPWETARVRHLVKKKQYISKQWPKTSLTACNVQEGAMDRWNPEVGWSGVKQHSEVLRRGANTDHSKILRLKWEKGQSDLLYARTKIHNQWLMPLYLTSMKLVSFSIGGGSFVGDGESVVVDFNENLTLEVFSLAMDLISSIVLPFSDSMRRTVRILCRGILEIRQG